MESLRFERREENRIVLTDLTGREYELEVDEVVVEQVKRAAGYRSEALQVRPALIQQLLRHGKNYREIIELTGVDRADIERYAHPVIAELRFLLARAHSVPVRVSTEDSTEEAKKFGLVIAQRLRFAGIKQSSWSIFQDESNEWIIELSFAHEGEKPRQASWVFEPERMSLKPANEEAAALSQQERPSDRLIPRLRTMGRTQNSEERAQAAPSRGEEAESLPVSETSHTSDAAKAPREEPAENTATNEPHTAADSTASETNSQQAFTAAASHHQNSALVEEEEYLRRKHIERLAINADTSTGEVDLGDTQNLLNQLKQRQKKREEQEHLLQKTQQSVGFFHKESATTTPLPSSPKATAQTAQEDTQVFHPTLQGSQVNITRGFETQPVAESSETYSLPQESAVAETVDLRHAQETIHEMSEEKDHKEKPAKRGRKSIPSWDDILFGTRSKD